jgi:hypothetical protein
MSPDKQDKQDKPRINYVIATHALNTLRRKEMGDTYATSVLRYHMYILSQTLTSESNITQITLVKPDVVDNVGYYNIFPYDKILEEKGIKVEHYSVENKGISYTQYLKCFKKYPDFDYYIIVEDDYTINIKYKDFDNILVDLHSKTFGDKNGFLDSWSPRGGLHGLEFHSAITLGILSKKSVDRLMENLQNIYLDQYQFSLELIHRGVPIVDMNQAGFPTRVLYWSTGNVRIEDYSENTSLNLEDVFYTPIQYYYDKITHFVKSLGRCIEVDNTFGIHNV